MQGYTYSIFSGLAIAIHLILNYNLLSGHNLDSMRARRYRGFLMGILAYYVFDAAWGVFAGLGWTHSLYAETVFFFLSLVVFVVMWNRFVVYYLDFGKWPSRILGLSGFLILAFNVITLAINPFCNCVYYFDAQGVYHVGWVRDPDFYLLIGHLLLLSIFVLVKALVSRDSVRRRSIMVLVFCLTMAVAMILQVVWPLTPFTALGCLIGNCFFHVFVIQDDQTTKHMAELEKALKLARAAEKAKSMFFSIVSHDIRTPLNAILGYSELLQCGIKTKVDRDEALRSIRASGTTLLQLVNDVLDLAKIDAGKMVLRPEPLLLSQLTSDVLETFRLSASRKGIELHNQTEAVPVVFLDEHRFRQILFNLIGNAVKFTDKGSITVSATYSFGRLEVSVVDTGCGIAPDMLKRVLDPFVQVQDPSHSPDRVGGSGLGLSICRRLVEMMGGELVVSSELGKGSTFKLTIPGVPSGGVVAQAYVGLRPAVELSSLPKRVLVVDDSPVNRAVLTALLKNIGLTAIDHACDGAEALSELSEAAKEGNPYDFVFSDFWMPNMNGLEMIEKLRADSCFDKLPVFAVTADTEFKRDDRSKLFTGVLLKPLTLDKLVDVLASVRQ